MTRLARLAVPPLLALASPVFAAKADAPPSLQDVRVGLYARYASQTTTADRVAQDALGTERNLNSLYRCLLGQIDAGRLSEEDRWEGLGLIREENAAAERLISAAEREIAKGVQRAAPSKAGAGRYVGHLSGGRYALSGARDLLEIEFALATAHADALGFAGHLIRLKGLNPPDAEQEASHERGHSDSLQRLTYIKRAAARRSP